MPQYSCKQVEYTKYKIHLLCSYFNNTEMSVFIYIFIDLCEVSLCHTSNKKRLADSTSSKTWWLLVLSLTAADQQMPVAKAQNPPYSQSMSRKGLLFPLPSLYNCAQWKVAD